MEGLEGSNSLEFNFEELEFIDGGLDDLKDEKGEPIKDPNQMTPEEIKAQEEAQKAAEDAAAEAAAKGKTPEEIEQERIAAEAAREAAEGTKTPEGVSGSSTEDGEGGDKTTSPQLYQTLADVLREKGVLSSVDDSLLKDVKDIEGIVNAVKEQIKAEELSDLSDTQKTVLKDMREGVSADTAGQFKNAMDKLNKIDDSRITEDKQVRFDLIFQDFVAKGYSREKAIKFANRSFALKEDEADAKEAKASLIKAVQTNYDKAKQKEIEAAQKAKDDLANEKESLKKRILEEKEVLKGMEVSEQLRKEVYEDMAKTVSNHPKTGEPENALMKYQRENPLEYNHKLYYLFKVTNGFKDLDYFKGKKTTSSVKALENALRQSTHVTGGGNPSFADDGQSHILDIGDLVLPGED